MASKTASSNALITTKAADASLNVQLHPLVLLTISDYITRHTSREREGPIVGAIIGQQNGRSFTLEHAYECKLVQRDGSAAVDGAWFGERLEQYKEVHKAPALDLVAMFMLGSVDGPTAAHVQLVKQVQELTSSDSIMLLLFHPELVNELQGGKLPITLYESVQEQDGGDMEIKFRELSFEVETGEAEMIGVDFVATGGGNATAVPKAEAATAAAESSSKEKKAKGEGKAKEKDGEDAETNGATSTNVLSPEDEELVASLTAKVNAIKMLSQRINLIRSYPDTLKSSYLTDASSTEAPPETANHPLLRSINSMLSRLPLLAPPTASTDPATTADASAEEATAEATPALPALTTAADKEKADVHLTSLLASLTRSLSEAQGMGAKFSILQREKQSKERKSFGGRGMGFGDEGSLLTGDTGGF